MKNLLSKPNLISWITILISLGLLTGAEVLVDPTRPPDALLPASATKQLNMRGALQVSAIFIYPDRSFAIINGQRAFKGDKIGEYTIINIHHDTVELKGSQDKLMVLSLFPTIKTAR